MDETKRKQQMLAEILEKHVKKDLGQINSDIQRNFYQTAQEALQYGIIDNIIFKKEKVD